MHLDLTPSAQSQSERESERERFRVTSVSTESLAALESNLAKYTRVRFAFVFFVPSNQMLLT